MLTDPVLQRYQKFYAQLLRLYPKSHLDRFSEGMKQTFDDLCHDRIKAGRGLVSLALWVFVETLAAIAREYAGVVTGYIMNRASTLFLRLVITLFAMGVLALCIFALPRMISEEAAKGPGNGWQIYLFLVGAYLQTALFLFSLHQAFKLLNLIDRNMTFSELSVRALRNIKRCAVGVGVLMVAGIGWIGYLSHGTGEDSAGPVMIGFVGTFISTVAAAVAAVLQSQMQKAIDMKKEGSL